MRRFRSIWRVLFPASPRTVDRRRLGGTALLEAQRPERFRGYAMLARTAGLVIVPLVLSSSVWDARATVPSMDSIGLLAATLLALMFFAGHFIVRQAGEAPSGFLKFFIRGRGISLLALGMIFTTVVVWLVAAGLPRESQGATALGQAGAFLYVASCALGLAAAVRAALQLVKVRRREFDQLHEWGNPVDGLLKRAVGIAITTPEIHKAVHFESDSVAIFPVPPDIAARFSDIEMAMTRGHVDQWMLDAESTPASIRFVPITDEWLERRVMLRASNYTMLGFSDREVSDEEILHRELSIDPDVLNPASTIPPKPRAAQLAEHITEKDFPLIQRFATEQSMTIVGYDLHRWNAERQRFEKLVYVQKATRQELEILDQISMRLLSGKTWDMWIEFHWLDNDEEDRDRHPIRLDSVIVKRSPVTGLDPDKRNTQWQIVVGIMPKGSNGWKVHDDQETGFVSLSYGRPRSLPETVSMRSLLPDQIDPGDWFNIVLGEDEHGHAAGLNLRDGPHALVVGPTGSGKTIALQQIAVSAMSRGHEVVLIDSVKGGADFTRFLSWFKACATTELTAQQTMLRVYAEVTRRKNVLIREGEGFWADIPEDVRRRERISPLTVIIDEFGSLVLQIAIPKGLDRTDPNEFERTQEINASKAAVLYYAGKLAREARFVGVHLAIALQRPDAEIISGELRSNLTSGLLLVKPRDMPKSATLTMVFPGTSAEAELAVRALDNGSRGLALVAAEGGSVAGLKVGYASSSEIPIMLNELGVPKPQRWDDLDDRGMPNTPPLSLTTADSLPTVASSKLSELFGE